jgi:hypothetical protein
MSCKFLICVVFNRFEIVHKIDIEYAISEQRRLIGAKSRNKSDLSPDRDSTEKIIKKNIKKWQRQSYGSARFWLCGCQTFEDAEEQL